MATLARLSFWVSPEQRDTFEATYEKKIVPILKKHDLVESSQRGRSTVEGVFSRLFEVETPSEVAIKERALQKDPAWQEVLRSLGTVFGTTQPDGFLRTRFGLYRTPAGPGKTVDAGPGFRQGVWHTFGIQDGLPVSSILDILQDQDGNLWFGTCGGGVSRYDGAHFTTFTTEDGLAGNEVWSIVEDREGHLWFGTEGGGVSCYGLPAAPNAAQAGGKEFATFTTEDGLAHNVVTSMLEDREGNLWFGTGGRWGTSGGGVTRYDAHRPDGEKFVTFTTEDGLGDNRVWAIVEDREGHLWFGTWGGGVSRYEAHHLDGAHRPDGEQFVTFTTQDGLGDNQVCSILQDPEGYLWFGTFGGGVSRYDGVQFATFTTEDGLANNGVMSLLEDREGRLWSATWRGVSRYDLSAVPAQAGGAQFTTFTTEDGLAGNEVWSILEDREGHLWFGTWGGGVSRYDAHRLDGEQFVTFTTEDGLADNCVTALLEDREGNLWFGTHGGGVSRYDGKEFVTFTTKDGLAGNEVWSILEDREGHLWFATGEWGTSEWGVSRYDAHRLDGEQFVTFTTEDGLADNWVTALLEDREGYLWFGTWGGGVSRYDAHRPDGEQFVTFTTEDGLAGNEVTSILEDRDGHLWFGTFGGGVSRHHGLVFQSLSRKDGLVSDTVQQILQDCHGDIWIATQGGITRYRSRRTPPAIRITDVIADRRYGSVPAIHLSASQKLLAFEFRGRSWTTPPDGMAYVVRLEGYDPDWKPIYTGRVEYHDLPLGEYTFQVKAVDRDLNYSEPATVRISVVPDPRLEAFAEALSGTSEKFVGDSQALGRVEEQLVEVAPTDLTVLISGETGTGKGLAARTVHGLSPRKTGPFIQVNCGAIPEGLVESELFGHEKGAFTGAVSRKLGKIELAEGGTLFLDEVGDLAAAAQAKLLQSLDERTFERVGGTETLQVDARVIAATNRDLKQMVEAGQFREDLYFRLQEFQVELPPLRERREDIPLLAKYFTARMAAHLDKKITHLTPEALAVLRAYAWPGNVRELEHAVNRAVVVCQGPAIRAEDIALEWRPVEGSPTEETVTLEEVERRHIREVLEQTGWVIKGPRGAAALLGLNEATLRSRMKKLGIKRP